MRGSCGAYQYHSKVHDVSAGGAAFVESFELVQIRIGVVFVEVFSRFFRVCLVRDGFIHERTCGVGRTVFAIRTRGQNGNVLEVGWA
jgi:hypothetical protein